jgi:hypothetical protein
VDDSVANKARELTANAKSEIDKIRAIGTYVQNLQYISIDIGVGYGNGYRPHTSSTVLSRAYGDCKDKANLMRALLRAVKIEAYPVAIYAGDRTHVREEWASPSQFNHCIVAIRITNETKAPAVIEHAKLGRLLIFDATDPYTSVGDLPDHEQGSFALIAAGVDGGLSKMPASSPEANMLYRNNNVTLEINGTLTGTIREATVGFASSTFRSEYRELSADRYKKAIEGWLTGGMTGAKASRISPTDKANEGKFDLEVDFSAQNYAQFLQNKMLIFKPVLVGRRNGVLLTEPKRNNPIVLNPLAISETTVFSLPVGFVVDELPDEADFQTDFGKYQTTLKVADGKLMFSRKLIIRQALVSADKYASVRDFYTKILAAESTPVVLLKK